MLKGRESLIRLIGKRRRFLPNRRSLLSDSIEITLNHCKKENVDSSSIEVGESSVQVSDCDWVTCPVCGEKVRGEGYMINSHLDLCLSRGKKRKLSQRTLLQLNFSAKPKVKVESTELQYTEPSYQIDSEEKSIICCKSPSNPALITDSTLDYLTENPVKDAEVNYRVDSPIEDITDESLEDISGVVLNTFIVGRKFFEEVDIQTCVSTFLTRDPNNPKDVNAVKVLSADSGCDKVIGFLPRELAQYISPLMDKFALKFEGKISSVPNSAFAVVPTEIMCQNKTILSEKEYEDFKSFRSLWKNAIDVVESMKNFPPSTAKYQQNFVLLLQEVLRTGSYLLTDDEKTFLETFLSLSSDSQNLFVRLYMRKGPWFRISNITYTEISDCHQASEDLSAAGYASYIRSTEELLTDDLKDILNLLTVGDLHEICRTVIKCYGWFFLDLVDIIVTAPIISASDDYTAQVMLYGQIRKRNCGSRKKDFIASILSSYKNGSCPILPSLVLEKTGSCIRISLVAETLIWRAERLFFLNGEQDLSSFLLVDLGIVKYPTYNCIITDQIFSCRNDLITYEEAIEVAQIMDQSLDENNSAVVLRCIQMSDSRISCSSAKAVMQLPESSELSESEPMASFFACFSASWVYSKVLLLGISFLEHENRYEDAISLLKKLLLNFSSDRRRGYWTLRLSIDLEHVGRISESLTVAENGLLDPCVRAGSKISLQMRVLRLGKPPRRWKIPSFSHSVKRKITEVIVQGRPLNRSTGVKSRFYGEDGEQCGVEELALQYYAGEGWHGVHTESGIWLTLFGLLMWDVIFADVANVFRTKFQTSPLDMETDSFYKVRKNTIEPLLQKIHQGMAEEILITSWEMHQGTSCRGVNWDKHSLTDLRAVISCVGGPCMAAICRHLAQDYRSWSSGMPDLLMWRFHGDYTGEAKLVEVKGPRDRLSEQQRAWVLFLMDSGFNAEVCRVTYL